MHLNLFSAEQQYFSKLTHREKRFACDHNLFKENNFQPKTRKQGIRKNVHWHTDGL